MIIRVKIYRDKRTYKDIYIEPHISLYTFAKRITDAFEFNFDHCFGFFKSPKIYQGAYDMEHYDLSYDLGYHKMRPHTQKVKQADVIDIFKEVKDKWWMLHGYSDGWLFELECRSVDDESKLKCGTVIKASGETPQQYLDEEDFENMNYDDIDFNR